MRHHPLRQPTLMLSQIRKTIATHFPHIHDQRILVALSGGADSTALALALHELGYTLHIAHIHHGIRGKAATTDASFAAALAKKLHAPFTLGKYDVPAAAKKTGESIEMAARRIRRDFLLKTAKHHRLKYIAVGHTADDQAETILLRIARGTSITGLAGIPYATTHSGITFIRPLRDATHAHATTYLKTKKQTWREDTTNTQDFALRNRVRNEILPLLEKRLNPQIRTALLRLADIATAEDEVMTQLAQKTRLTPKTPLALRRRLTLQTLQASGLPPEKQTFHTVENPSKNFTYYVKSPKSFYVLRKNSDLPRTTGYTRNKNKTYLSSAAVAGRDLVLRSWRAGDKMQPLGMTGTKKLSDIFTDLKIPRPERPTWAVVECGGEIAALLGWRVSRPFAVESPTAPSLLIPPPH